MADRRTRFERRVQLEERLEKSLDNLMDAASGLDGVNDLDEITSGLETVEKELGRAKRQAERLMDGER